jgi:hypothetical protein
VQEAPTYYLRIECRNFHFPILGRASDLGPDKRRLWERIVLLRQAAVAVIVMAAFSGRRRAPFFAVAY